VLLSPAFGAGPFETLDQRGTAFAAAVRGRADAADAAGAGGTG
jgi:hypothetical protein